jgi:hypothetical protein
MMPSPGTNYVKCDADGNIIGWGYVSVAMIPNQVLDAGETIIPATAEHVRAVGLASSSGDPMPYKVDLAGQTTVTVIESVSAEDPETNIMSQQSVSTDHTFEGVVVET